MKKRVISAFLAALMLLTILPVTVLATEETAQPVTGRTEDLTVDGVGSVGMLLSKTLTEEQQEQSGELEHIADLEITGNVATVSYQVLEDDCSVVVAIYDDLNPEVMLTSGTAEVTADKTKVTVELAGTMPEHFLATAYLIDRATLAPRCAAFTTQLYTKEMQEFLSTTVADYDPDLVLNLDDDDTTNFAVFSEDTQQLEGNINKNQLTDNGDGTYTVTNADESVTSLQVGDVFSYPLENNQMLLVKIKDITLSGTTVTITEDEDVALEDFFDYFKVETDGSGGKMTVDSSTCGEGVTYTEDEVTPPVLNALVDEDASLNYSASFKLDKTLSGGDSAKVKLIGSVGLDFGVSLKCYIDLSYQYISLKIDTKLNFSAGFSGKVTMTEIPLGRIEIPVLPCINVGFTPAFVTEVSAKIECKGSVKTTIGFAYDSDVGFINLSSWPKLEAKVEFSGTLFVGFQAEPYVAIISADLCKASVKCSAGVEIEGKQTIAQPSESSRHDCIGCIAGTVSTRLEVSVGVDIIKGWLKKEAKIAATKKKYGDFYCSLDHLEFGWGTCPHISYKTTVTVKMENGDPAPHAIINGTKLATAPVTNAGGQAVFYLPNGTYTLFVTNGGQTTKKTVTIHDSGKSLTITYGEADSGGSGGRGTYAGEPILSYLLDEGSCGADGDNVKWKLDQNGLLYIYGTGAIRDFSDRIRSWYRYQDSIKQVVIGDGITSIGDFTLVGCHNLMRASIPNSVTRIGNCAFSECTRLTNVTIPNSVTSIGYAAFNRCSSLTFVSIPDSVTSIGYQAFYECSSLTSVTIPDGVSSIGDNTFNSCVSLDHITIPDSVITIGYQAFAACSSLTGVTIGTKVTSIGVSAFNSCHSLDHITIPDSVTTIGDWAFSSCESLTSITIPDSVLEISDYAFYGCTNLTDVYYTGTQAQWNNIAIYSNNDPLVYAAIHYTATAPVVNAAPVVSAAAERPATPTELPVPEFPVPPMPQRETLFEELSAPTPLGAMLPPAENTVAGETVTSRFTGLLSGVDYVLLVVKDPTAEDLLSPENLLYIAQGTAENGTVSFTYCLLTDAIAWPYAGGLLPADCNGDDTLDVLDMAALYAYLSTGAIEGKLSAGSFSVAADVNGDGSVNILDYQALYKLVRSAPRGGPDIV